nr:sigma-70 family RNA polymerase sigma factor [Saccharothrix sp.]
MTEAVDQRRETDFLRGAEGLRRELLAFCYRMVGSAHEAEDLVQETYLRAWRAFDRFENRSSVRTWMYRIATSACLNALEGRSRRPLPMGLGPNSDPSEDVVERPEVPWLEPLPDDSPQSDSADPAVLVAARETVRLAFVATLQHLTPRQRAVLVLREVLMWPAADTAAALGTTTAAVNSMLQRARAHLDRLSPRSGDVMEPTTAAHRRLLDEYVAAWEQKNVPAIVDLLTQDAAWEMPPLLEWYLGREHIAHHLTHRCSVRPGQARLVRADANGQPAFATYTLEPDGRYHAAFLQVLTLTDAGISHVYAFLDVNLFESFNLPAVVD